MYNDYYLISIDNKLDKLTDIVNNQQTILTNQQTIIDNQIYYTNELSIGFVWLLVLLFALLFYNFYHRSFRH